MLVAPPFNQVKGTAYPFFTMIVTVIVVGPVAIFFSVCFIVFMVETNAVAKRKTVMRG
ncbi:Uncharacterised protein [Escherichia coli]|nr:Uncharacterised protein [Escherichia coli]